MGGGDGLLLRSARILLWGAWDTRDHELLPAVMEALAA